jgi:hypothetical protein
MMPWHSHAVSARYACRKITICPCRQEIACASCNRTAASLTPVRVMPSACAMASSLRSRGALGEERGTGRRMTERGLTVPNVPSALDVSKARAAAAMSPVGANSPPMVRPISLQSGP